MARRRRPSLPTEPAGSREEEEEEEWEEEEEEWEEEEEEEEGEERQRDGLLATARRVRSVCSR